MRGTVSGEGAQSEIRPGDAPPEASVSFGMAALLHGFAAQAQPGAGQVGIDADGLAEKILGAGPVSGMKRGLSL
jgi:hypothetical protein